MWYEGGCGMREDVVCGRMWYEGVVCGVRKSDTWKDTLREGWGEVYTHMHPCN